MKEDRYFYVPDADTRAELPDEETQHATRVLRLKEGDQVFLMDGRGCHYRAQLTLTTPRCCRYEILESLPQQRPWPGHIHLAVAPTKMMDRMEWLMEKATEVGIDEMSLLDCRFSERRVVKTERLRKIAIAAMKQSRKAWLPVVNDMTDFREFIAGHPNGRRYIAHCYGETGRTFLFDELRHTVGTTGETIVLIGPEGDFSFEEVGLAVEAGWQSVHLGGSRLRTETAGLAAVMMMQLSNDFTT